MSQNTFELALERVYDHKRDELTKTVRAITIEIDQDTGARSVCNIIEADSIELLFRCCYNELVLDHVLAGLNTDGEPGRIVRCYAKNRVHELVNVEDVKHPDARRAARIFVQRVVDLPNPPRTMYEAQVALLNYWEDAMERFAKGDYSDVHA